MLQCIGQRKEKTGKVRCENTGVASDPRWPEVYLCADCANSRQANSTLAEGTNVSAMQSDYEEFRDQIAAGFAAGAQRSYDGGGEE